jgi:hypothetical protein
MKNSLDFIDPRRIGVAIFMTLMLAAMITKPAGASAVYRFDVTYTEGSIKSGPLSFGLSTLPTSVFATFRLGPGQGDIEGDGLSFDDSDVVSASITFGDTTWSRNDLDNFSMTSFATGVDFLNYQFSLNSNPGQIVLNFPLTITGTDEATGQSFEYEYAESTPTLTALPIPPAVWLFGSGLLGLVGIARREKAAKKEE